MARYITVSTLGPEPLRFSGGKKLFGEEAVERMCSFWRGQLDQVLMNKPDVVVIPEACDRFPEHTMKERYDYYKFKGNQIRDFLAAIAKEHGCYITYSAVYEAPDGTWRNATQLLNRSGEVAGVYHKNHVVIEETTQGNILCGKEAPVFDCDFGRVACAICFDLNFDELRLKYAAAKPELILFSSMYHGGLMQAYWAYSCRAHFVGAIAGDQCTVISPVGETLATTTNYFSHVTTRINLDCKVAHLDYNWGKFRAMEKKYGPEVKVYDPGHLGSVLISSESEARSIDDLAAEFEIELLDDYMERALAHRHTDGHIEP